MRPRSSAGQSSGFLTRVSQVRVLPGAPVVFVGGEGNEVGEHPPHPQVACAATAGSSPAGGAFFCGREEE